MPAYIVRMRDGAKYNGPRLVGMFVGDDLDHIAALADQVDVVTTMEAAEAPYGGLMIAAPEYEVDFDEYCDPDALIWVALRYP